MSSDRLRFVEEQLTILREQQASLEREALLTTGLFKTQAEQRSKLEIKPKIREYEQEYWQILAAANQSAINAIAQPDADVIVAEIVQSVNQLEVKQAYPPEIMQILLEIRDTLNQPEPSAAAKLKGVLSAVPPFINLSYEAELDTENFFRTYFPTFRKSANALAKSLAKKL